MIWAWEKPGTEVLMGQGSALASDAYSESNPGKLSPLTLTFLALFAVFQELQGAGQAITLSPLASLFLQPPLAPQSCSSKTLAGHGPSWSGCRSHLSQERAP